jgi:hypothetical protein
MGSRASSPTRGIALLAVALLVHTVVGWPEGSGLEALAEAVRLGPASDGGLVLRGRWFAGLAAALTGALLAGVSSAGARPPKDRPSDGAVLEISLAAAATGLLLGAAVDARWMSHVGAPFAPWLPAGPASMAMALLGSLVAAGIARRVDGQRIVLLGCLALLAAGLAASPGGWVERASALEHTLLGAAGPPRAEGWAALGIGCGALLVGSIRRSGAAPAIVGAARVVALGPALGLPTAIARLGAGPLGAGALAVLLLGLPDALLGPGRAPAGIGFAAAGCLAALLPAASQPSSSLTAPGGAASGRVDRKQRPEAESGPPGTQVHE